MSEHLETLVRVGGMEMTLGSIQYQDKQKACRLFLLVMIHMCHVWQPQILVCGQPQLVLTGENLLLIRNCLLMQQPPGLQHDFDIFSANMGG
jgi:hypothetical protein